MTVAKLGKPVFIDPAETRGWILRGLRSVPPMKRPKRRRVVDTW